MTRKSEPFAKASSSSDEPDTPRTADGRFRKGFCPNPNGRPPKPKPDPHNALARALAKAIPLADGGEMSMAEYLAAILMKQATNDPRLAFALLREHSKFASADTHAGETIDEQALEVFKAHAARLERREAARSTTAKPKRARRSQAARTAKSPNNVVGGTDE